MSLQTPLGRVRGLGAAKSGTHHWWMQKVTAIALIPLTVWLITSLLRVAGADYATASAWLHHPLNATLMLAFLGTGLYHLKLGIQVVIEDYVHGEVTKHAAQLANSFISALIAISATLSVLKVFLGA